MTLIILVWTGYHALNLTYDYLYALGCKKPYSLSDEYSRDCYCIKNESVNSNYTRFGITRNYTKMICVEAYYEPR